MEYKIQGEGIPTFFKSEHAIFSLLASSRFFQLDFSHSSPWCRRYTSIEKEELLYPSSTMIAEVGGILSLFLGVSFMTIWDGGVWVKKQLALLKIPKWQ